MLKSDPKSDAKKPTEKSVLLGQVFTPKNLARRMSEFVISRHSKGKNILDPCVGPGTFPSALYESDFMNENDTITAYDIDELMVEKTKRMIPKIPNLVVEQCDYLDMVLNDTFDIAILNPPYVRQEWVSNKSYYQNIFKERYGLSVPGTSNLYVYFIVKIIMDLKDNGEFVCIVYDSWQSTRYGLWLFNFLKSTCSNLEVTPVEGAPFDNKLIDATIISGKKKNRTDKNYEPILNTTFTSKGPFVGFQGFNTLENLGEVKRGLRLKQADFFLCEYKDLERLEATPFIKKVSKVNGYSISRDHPEAALIISDGENLKKEALNELERRLELARKNPAQNKSILTWHNERPDNWFKHRPPLYAPILFNYYIRNRPKHFFNFNRAYSDNFYGINFKSQLPVTAYIALMNSTIVATEIIANSRNQGSGLAKIQLFEYRACLIPDLRLMSSEEISVLSNLGEQLIDSSDNYNEPIIYAIDSFLAKTLNNRSLEPDLLRKLYLDYDNKTRKPRKG